MSITEAIQRIIGFMSPSEFQRLLGEDAAALDAAPPPCHAQQVAMVQRHAGNVAGGNDLVSELFDLRAELGCVLARLPSGYEPSAPVCDCRAQALSRFSTSSSD